MSRVRQTAKRLLDGKGQGPATTSAKGRAKEDRKRERGGRSGRGGGGKAGEKTFTSFRTYFCEGFSSAASVTHRLHSRQLKVCSSAKPSVPATRGRNSGKRGEAWDSCETAELSRASLRHFLSCFGGYALCLGLDHAGAILDDVLMAVLCSLYRSRSAASCPRIISATRSCSSRNSCIISGVAGTG